MILKRKLSVLVLALSAAAVPMWPAGAVQMQPQPSMPHVRVEAFDVEQLRHVTPGSELEFTLNGTPGAQVSLQIAGATGSVQMAEVQPGRYTGSYTVRTRDRITAESLVTARLVKDGEAVSAALNESLVIGARSPAPVETARIEAFTVTAPDPVRPGDELNFSLTGAPGGQARVSVRGIEKPIALAETSRGVYEGSYTVRRGDRLRGELSATGFLKVDQRETSQLFDRAQARDGARRDSRDESRAVPTCVRCGVVESVEVVEVDKSSPNVLGTIAGGVVGGLLGNQVGGGTGKGVATVAGAIGGAYAGNQIEKKLSKKNEYRVVVRLDSGGTQTLTYAEDPAIKVGALVRIENDLLVRR